MSEEESKCACGQHTHEHDHDHAHTHEHTHEDGTTHCHEHTHEDGTTHSHEHTHGDGTAHCHEHTHEDGTTHSHEHTHSHPHTHGGAGSTPAEVIALLSYMADHNEHHASELADMGEKLRALGKTEAADKIAEGVAEFSKANEKLNEALKMVKELA